MKKMIACCRPVGVSQLSEILGDLPIPPPQIDDVVKNCDGCKVDIWVSPLKLASAQQKILLLFCWLCVAKYARMSGKNITDFPIIDLNPDRPDRPRP